MVTTTPPSPQAPSLVSQVVKIVGTTRYDGDVGFCVGFNQERNRYSVKLDVATVISVKPENLLLANAMDKVKYRFREAKWKSQQLINDPKIRQQARQAYMMAASMLPTYLPPERLVLLLLMLSIITIRFVGFFKSFIVFSLIMLPISVSLKDIMRDRSVINNPVVLMKRFPTNLKNAVVEATGFAGLSDNMVLAALGLFVALAIKILLTPAGISQISISSESPLAPDLNRQLRELYKLGFEDGTRGKDYGASLADGTLEDYVSLIGGVMSYTGKPVDSFEWSDTPSQKPSMWRKLNFGTIMTLATIAGILLKPRRQGV